MEKWYEIVFCAEWHRNENTTPTGEIQSKGERIMKLATAVETIERLSRESERQKIEIERLKAEIERLKKELGKQI